MSLIPQSVFSDHAAYRLLRSEGAGRLEIEKIFDAFAGTPPAAANIEEKLALLRRLGFPDPVKMIVSSPAILGYAAANIEEKLALLRRLGFPDPVKMIVTLPAILGLAAANIEEKLALLRRLGFPDPHSLVSRLPTILGYAPKRLRFVGRVVYSLQDGNAGLFLELVTKDPILMAAAAIATLEPTTKGLRSAMRARKGAMAENMGLIQRFRTHKVARAFFRYRPLVVEMKAAA